MKVKCIDKASPRSDGQPGGATGITVGKVYTVAEVVIGRRDVDQYSIINDDFKMARYNQCRFEVVDDSPVRPLREAFNSLTTEMRSYIKYLENRDCF
ncbi:hypothetical protein VCM_00034 [Pseudomonas phage VCM]|uniref:Uncharacterized protein n=1 Tax=Pseudomonas phage VCM TaxID=1729937 RepID=A0A0S4KXC1_9CAUD|nr:hypothetical protein VCM_00034 [Pseudomonas phage VCM]CUR44253.1 hypothetical protein VCM_00034 [Pseudomonas phage VCM]